MVHPHAFGREEVKFYLCTYIYIKYVAFKVFYCVRNAEGCKSSARFCLAPLGIILHWAESGNYKCKDPVLNTLD